MASATRVRTLVDMLQHHGAIEIVPSERDRRSLRLVPTDLLHDTHLVWLESVLPAVTEMFVLPPLQADREALRGLARRYATSIMLRNLMDRFTIFDGFPEVETFMNRRHGYLLVLELACHDGLHTEVRRAEAAKRYGVSPAHIATLLADAEKKGWLTRVPRASDVELSSWFAERLDIWVAREIAIVGLWLQTKLGGQQGRLLEQPPKPIAAE